MTWLAASQKQASDLDGIVVQRILLGVLFPCWATEEHACGYAGSAWESSAAKIIFQQGKRLTYMLAREGAYLVAVWFGRALLARRYLIRN